MAEFRDLKERAIFNGAHAPALLAAAEYGIACGRGGLEPRGCPTPGACSCPPNGAAAFPLGDHAGLVEEARRLVADIDEYNAITKRDAGDEVRDLIARLADALSSRSPGESGSALRYVANALWEQDAEREVSTDHVYCGRCEAEGGAYGARRGTVHWADVPHDKDCLYTIIGEGLKPSPRGYAEGLEDALRDLFKSSGAFTEVQPGELERSIAALAKNAAEIAIRSLATKTQDEVKG